MIEAGRGMGMREGQLLRRVEVPLALPVILAGIRISATQTVATATLAAVVSGGTLGVIIIQGINGGDRVRLVGSALLVALLSIGPELLFAWIQRRATARGVDGVSSEPGTARAADGAHLSDGAGSPVG
jgi:osmoprotectant transport system permease protein